MIIFCQQEETKMTKNEFEEFVNYQKKKGKTVEEIAETFCGMFVDNKINRPQLEFILGQLGLELEEEFQKMNDEELKKNLFK